LLILLASVAGSRGVAPEPSTQVSVAVAARRRLFWSYLDRHMDRHVCFEFDRLLHHCDDGCHPERSWNHEDRDGCPGGRSAAANCWQCYVCFVRCRDHRHRLACSAGVGGICSVCGPRHLGCVEALSCLSGEPSDSTPSSEPRHSAVAHSPPPTSTRLQCCSGQRSSTALSRYQS